MVSENDSEFVIDGEIIGRGDDDLEFGELAQDEFLGSRLSLEEVSDDVFDELWEFFVLDDLQVLDLLDVVEVEADLDLVLLHENLDIS